MLYRFSLDLAIPKAVYDSIPVKKKLQVWDVIRYLKGMAIKINEGQDNLLGGLYKIGG